MGGKAGSRVAGNAKPTNSGRIRELLINKHGAGNIITFSALSNSERPENFASQSKTQDKETKREPQNEDPPSQNEKPTLVVKRIGNRDFFTRVRMPRDNLDDSSNIANSKNSDLSRPTISSPIETLKDGVIIVADKLDQSSSQSSHDDKQNNTVTEESDDKSVDTKENHDFDELLDRLSKISIDNLPNLEDEQSFANETRLIDLLSTLVKFFKEDLSLEEWDLINRSIYKWTDVILNSDKLSKNELGANFCVKVFDFIYQLISLAKSLKEDKNLEETFPMANLLLNDWENFRSSKAYHDLVTLYFKLTSVQNLTSDESRIVEALASLIIDVDSNMILADISLSKHLVTKVEFDPELELPETCRFCDMDEKKSKNAPAISNLLKSNQRIITVIAHSMLTAAIPQMCENAEAATILPEQDDLNNLILLPPTALMTVLSSRDSIMSVLLSDYRVGDISVTIEPDSDAYSCTLAYLFTWDLVIKFIVNMDKEAGQFMIHSLKKLGFIQRLLDNIFMLLPPLGERDSLNLRFDSDNGCSKNQITNLMACHMPVTVRKWYNNNSNKRLCNLVNEYTTKHISSVICSLEMESVQEKCQERANLDKLNNLCIKARPSAREVYAIYTRDEFKMELTIKLPTNYPLSSVQIDGGKRVGVTDVKWRSWLLQLTTFLAHQNGPILDGIDLWRRNIDKRFEGIDKCMICFSILHSNYQLPKKKCRTCTKVFHNLCLYKWFEASGNSTCPLCRNIW